MLFLYLVWSVYYIGSHFKKEGGFQHVVLTKRFALFSRPPLYISLSARRETGSASQYLTWLISLLRSQLSLSLLLVELSPEVEILILHKTLCPKFLGHVDTDMYVVSLPNLIGILYWVSLLYVCVSIYVYVYILKRRGVFQHVVLTKRFALFSRPPLYISLSARRETGFASQYRTWLISLLRSQ